MKSLVAMTYYQLMHSIALALTFEEKPNLYFSMDFLNPDEVLLERIADTGVFNEVRGITWRGEFPELVKELRKTYDMEEDEIDALGSSLFEKYLEPQYEEDFENADKSDEIFVYNDFQYHYYYICKHFDNIVGVEDGYASLQQQIGIHRFKGDKERLEPFIEKGYYPEPLYRHEKVRKIISSVDFEDLDDYYRSKLFVWDYKDIVAQNEDKFKKALLQIFDVEKMGITGNSSLYLGQPLDRSRYCNAVENYLLCRKIIRNENDEGLQVYYKPHPAERNDPRMFGSEKAKVLPKDFPVEVFNYRDEKFDRLVTFGSTGASIATCAKESKVYFTKTDFDRQDVTDAVREQIEGEKLSINMFIKVKEMTPETYVNVYSCIFRKAYVRTSLYLLIPEGKKAEYEEYFDKKHLKNRVQEYKRTIKGSKEGMLWHKELGWIKTWLDRYDPYIEFCEVSSYDDWSIYREVIHGRTGYDYLMLLEEGNPGFTLTNEIAGSLRARIHPIIFFRLQTTILNASNRPVNIALNPGYLGDHYNGELINKVWHREVIRRLEEGECTKENLAILTADYTGYIRKREDLTLSINADRYLDIEDGKSYYGELVEQIIRERTDESEDIEGRLANVVYDYYDWLVVSGKSPFTLFASVVVEDLIEDEAYQFEVYKIFADAMLKDRAVSNSRGLIQEINYYQGIKPIMDKAVDVGLLKGIENVERARRKLHLTRRRKRK
ncbi:MAG: hypothetical protein IJJ31_02445 [Mogibacterium sp.]|nr:hypothetical protein [Mogibacterium sp.]